MRAGQATGPRYVELVEGHRKHFPTVSARSMGSLWKVIAAVKEALSEVDFRRPMISGIKGDDTPKRILGNVGQDLRGVVSRLTMRFEGMPNWGSQQMQKNLMPPTTSVSVAAALLAALFNPDICSTEFSGERIAEAEKKTVKELCELIGFKQPNAFGFFTYGGTSGINLGILLGLENAYPGRHVKGQEGGARILCSNVAHFSVRDAAGRLGVGASNVVQVKTDEMGEMFLKDLDIQARMILERDKEARRMLQEHPDAAVRREKISTVVATMGTTDTFGLDDIHGIHSLIGNWQKDYKLDYPITLLADSVVGWAWSFFIDYDFTLNPLQFKRETLDALEKIVDKVKYLHLADVVTANIHKYGYVMIPGSYVLVAGGARKLSRIKRGAHEMPQLYRVGSDHPGAYSSETTRYAGGVLATMANMSLFGKEGYQAMLGRITEMGLYFRHKLAMVEGIEVVNSKGLGGGTLFYPRVSGALREQNQSTNMLSEDLEGLPDEVFVSTTTLPNGRIMVKSMIMSPFTTEDHMDRAVESIAKAVGMAFPK